MLSTDTNYYCEKSWKDGLFYLQEKGNRKEEVLLMGHKTIKSAWDSLGFPVEHPRRYQIELCHGRESFSYLYVIQGNEETQEELERKVQAAYSIDYKKQMKCTLRWAPYSVRPTVKVKELKRGISNTLRGGNHFSIRCA